MFHIPVMDSTVQALLGQMAKGIKHTEEAKQLHWARQALICAGRQKQKTKVKQGKGVTCTEWPRDPRRWPGQAQLPPVKWTAPESTRHHKEKQHVSWHQGSTCRLCQNATCWVCACTHITYGILDRTTQLYGGGPERTRCNHLPSVAALHQEPQSTRGSGT